MQGYGAPAVVPLAYGVKVALFVAGWVAMCGLSGEPDCFTPFALQKLILWAWAWEQLGLGCGSGPLTGRYVPPVGGALYWLRPGTVRLPWLGRLPGLKGTRRSGIDVGLYALLMLFLARALLAPELTWVEVLPPVVLLPLLTLRDRVQFLAARGEHYWVTAVCFLWADDWIPAAMAVQLAIWMWAAVSKLTPQFASVISVMTSNSPFTPWPRLRRAMVRAYPTDLRPSGLARLLAHGGAALEFGFPLLLLWGDGGPVTALGLAGMLAFHLYISSNVPMGVPLEWNVVVVVSAFILWGGTGELSPLDLEAPLLVAFLLVFTVLVPLVGHLSPRHVSFLLAMRYYAGNWPYTVWAFTPEALARLDARVTTSAPPVHEQLAMVYDPATAVGSVGKVLGFRHMHLHGRALHDLLPRFVPDLDHRVVLDGELVAGQVLGWNFGDGHLSGPALLAAVQERCGFALGDVRVVCVESQPLHRWRQAWEAWDAKGGRLAQGSVSVRDLLERQPFPEG
jgi:hypothetical protein